MLAQKSDQKFRLSDLAPAVSLLIVLLIGLTLALLSPTGKTEQYVIMVAPWNDLNSVFNSIQAANGTLISVNTAAATFITVHSDQKDFVNSLYSDGLWFVFEPGQIEGCIGIAQRAMSV